MSNVSDIKDSNYYIDWLKKSINDGYLSYYDYSEFKNIQLIGGGAHGSVVRANWKSTDTILALKSFNNKSATIYKEVVNEVKF
jgi:hypothetical protein